MHGSHKVSGSHSQRGQVIARVLIAMILLVISAYIIRSLPAEVDASFRSNADVTQDPERLLNHANTYYWWGRYRKNTLPEFDTAAKMAAQALQLAKDRLHIDADSGRYRTVERQATKIMTLSREQAEICRYNLSTYVPAYMEIMGHEQAYMQEDADGEDVPFIALRGAISRLTELLSPNRNQPIGSLSHFTLLNVNTYNPLAEEMLVQELNNSTRMYTISRHELSRILGHDTVRITDFLGDSTALARIARAYDTDELAVIDFQENDRVNGIYYYGMRLRFWSVDKGWQSRNVYTEFMTRDRVFNQMSGIIFPLFLAFLLTAFALNLLLNTLVKGSRCWSRVSMIHLPLCFLLGTIVQYVLVTFVLEYFLNPAPEDYFTSDGGELWVIAYPLTFILPAFTTYLILGKMDNFIARFRSDLENPAALFALASGTLLTIPCVFTYNRVIRFGTGLELSSILPLIGLLTAFAFLISRHWASIINFPERVHPFHRFSTWLALIAYVWLVFSLLSDLLLHHDPGHLRDWMRVSMLPVVALVELVHYLLKRFIRPKLRMRELNNRLPDPIGLEDFMLTPRHQGLCVTDRASGMAAASMYVRSERGMPVGAAVESHFNLKERKASIRIDFSATRNSTDVHYASYAQGFEDYLPKVKFNDATETARKTTNLLGRLISAVSSIGGVMIDERTDEGRDPVELSRLLLDIPWQEPGIWFFDHVEDMKEEDLVLLEYLIREIRERRTSLLSPEGNRTDNPPLPLLICCGFGEFGLRDRLYAALTSLVGEDLSGFHVYTARYDQPAKFMLAREDFPIQVRLHLESLFRRERRDHTPGFIAETLAILRRRGVFHQDPQMPFSLAALDQLVTLPDIDANQSMMSLNRLEPALQQVLIAAAYIVDEHGRFQMPVLAHIVKMDRMPLLHLLKEAERQNLVSDLKGLEHFYRYAFTDRTIIAGLKRLDNPRQEEVSQIAYECYREYVGFHLPDPYASNILDRLRQVHQQGVLDTESIMLLATRAYAVRPVFPLLAFRINHAAAMMLFEPGLARFDEALQCVERAFDLMSVMDVTDHPQTRSMMFDLKKLRFKLWMETGRIQQSDADAWLDEIKGDEHYANQSETERISFLLSEIRFRFTRFSSIRDDATKGNGLCEQLMAEPLNVGQRRWVRFYMIKLIPIRHYTPGTEGWQTVAIRIHALYRELLMELEADRYEFPETRELYRQVLNDYGGSFLGDKILPITMAGNPTDDVKNLLLAIGKDSSGELMEEVESLLSKRIVLELLKTNVPKPVMKPLHKESLMILLMNEDPSIDKRGICFTLNYMSRAYLTTGMEVQSVEIGEMAYRFNTLVGDKTGSCLAAGTLGYAYEQLSEPMKAYEWFECSFGHGWEIGHWSAPIMALQTYRMANKASNPSFFIRSEAYLYQIALRAVIPFFPSSSSSDALAHQLMLSPVSLKKIMSLQQADAFLGLSVEAFVDRESAHSFAYWKEEAIKKGDVSGTDKADWSIGGNMPFNWKVTSDHNASIGIERMKLILKPADTEKSYEFIIQRTIGSEDWFICSLKILK